MPVLTAAHRWLTATGLIAAAVSIAFGCMYVFYSFRGDAVRSVEFLSAVGVSAAICIWFGHLMEQRRLRPLRKVAQSPQPTEDQLAEAAVVIRQAADTGFWVTITLTPVFYLLIVVLWTSFKAVSAIDLARLAFVCAFWAPITALSRYIPILLRGRVLLEKIVTAGLSPARLVEVLPKSFDFRSRLMLFGLVLTVTAQIMLWDVTVVRFWADHQPQVSSAQRAQLGDVASATDDIPNLPIYVIGVYILLLVVLIDQTGTAVMRPLARLAGETERISRGDYRQNALVIAESETGEAAAAVFGLEEQLIRVAKAMDDASEGLGAAATALTQGEAHFREGAMSQTTSLHETTATTAELAQSARSIAETSLKVSELAQRTLDVAKNGNTAAGQFVDALRRISANDEHTADSVLRINARMVQVEKVVQFVAAIGERSDLLALNAELEAFKVGEVGRGFGLIAIEMRRLAENIVGATQEIVRLVNDVRDATEAAVMATEAGVKAGQAGVDLAQKVKSLLSQIVDFAERSASAIQLISLATVQQQMGTDQLAQSMTQVLESTTTGIAAADLMVKEQRQLLDACQAFAKTLNEIMVRP
jgi:methyl-accepting chemotaxis protein